MSSVTYSITSLGASLHGESAGETGRGESASASAAAVLGGLNTAVRQTERGEWETHGEEENRVSSGQTSGWSAPSLRRSESAENGGAAVCQGCWEGLMRSASASSASREWGIMNHHNLHSFLIQYKSAPSHCLKHTWISLHFSEHFSTGEHTGIESKSNVIYRKDNTLEIQYLVFRGRQQSYSIQHITINHIYPNLIRLSMSIPLHTQRTKQSDYIVTFFYITNIFLFTSFWPSNYLILNTFEWLRCDPWYDHIYATVVGCCHFTLF